MTHVPSGTMETIVSALGPSHALRFISRAATVDFLPSKLTVPAGSTRPVKVTVRPPTKLQASRFPVYSGFITAIGSDGSTLRSVYLGLAASMKQMKILNPDMTYMPTKSGHIPDDWSISDPSVYTMGGYDLPVLAIGFFFTTPLLRLELIDADENANRVVRSLHSSSRCGYFAQRMYGCVERTPSSGLARSILLSSLKIVGLIEERWNDGLIRWGWARPPSEDVDITRFADRSAVPNGRYRLLLRVLKRYGNPNNIKDYEMWIGPEFIIRQKQDDDP